MIKVIASDLDGTLLNEKHCVSERTAQAVKDACAQGIRFMIVTGRTFQGALQALGESGIICDYIVSSGAQVRDCHRKTVEEGRLNYEACEKSYEILKKYEVQHLFCTDEKEYCVGNEEDLENNILKHIKAFDGTVSEKQLKEHFMYPILKKKTENITSVKEIKNKSLPISKLFIFVDKGEIPDGLCEELQKISNLAICSSGENNLEVTDVDAQKGNVLKRYIESLGYGMEEVMVFGDSMNDYSMLSMDYGVTIAMENADSQIKEVCKYVTKSNTEDGVAYAIEQLLKQNNRK